MSQPRKHGRDHLPSGYAALVTPYTDSADLLEEGAADQVRSKLHVPTTGGASVEWYYVDSLTNWSSGGATVLDWRFRNGSWDTSYPTFSINASDNVEIAKDGVYDCWIFAVNYFWNGAPTTTNSIRLEVARLAGETPAGYHGWGTGSYNDIVRQAVEWATPTSIAATRDTKVQGTDFFVFSPGSFPGAGACEFSWRATRDEDGTFQDDINVVTHWIIFRRGDEWSE